MIPLAAVASVAAAAEGEAVEASQSELVVVVDSQRCYHLARTTETSFQRRSEA